MKMTYKILIILVLTVGLMGLVQAKKGIPGERPRNDHRKIKAEDIIKNPESISNPDDVYSMNRTEVYPDLSGSSLVADSSEAEEGDIITYTANLMNTGNVNATDIDVLIEIGNGFELPTDVRFSGCGNRQRAEIGHEMELSNITVRKNNNCRITFDVTLEAGVSDADIVNALHISPAAEGGVEIGPLYAKGLSVQSIAKETEVAPSDPPPDMETEVPPSDPPPEEETEALEPASVPPPVDPAPPEPPASPAPPASETTDPTEVPEPTW